MRCLFFGSRNLTWKHLRVMRVLAGHAHFATQPELASWLPEAMADDDSAVWGMEWIPETEPLVLLHGDGPPGRTPGAIGADKLSEVACMERWPTRRVLRRFPADPVGDESWGQAAARCNAAMVAAKPHRAYCVHENLDASKGSVMTAGMLTRAGIRYHYVRVSPAGAVTSVEER